MSHRHKKPDLDPIATFVRRCKATGEIVPSLNFAADILAMAAEVAERCSYDLYDASRIPTVLDELSDGLRDMANEES